MASYARSTAFLPLAAGVLFTTVSVAAPSSRISTTRRRRYSRTATASVSKPLPRFPTDAGTKRSSPEGRLALLSDTNQKRYHGRSSSPNSIGSDNGGSLRNPGNFNNIVGFRPTFGLVPTAPNALPFLGFSVNGPLARSVADVALLMSVMAGPDPRDPSCWPSDRAQFRGSLERDFRGTRVAWCPDLGGLPLDSRVRAVLEAQRKTFESMGCVVEDAAPDLSDAEHVFITIRSFRTAANLGSLLDNDRDQLKKDAIDEIEAGRALTSAEVARAMLEHGRLLERMRKFQDTYEFTLCAVNQLPPFDAAIDWSKEIAGVSMEHYIAWMKSAYWITATFCPAISVPAGFTSDGLPVGLQIVGGYRDDLGVLQIAHALEQATGFGRTRPQIAQA